MPTQVETVLFGADGVARGVRARSHRRARVVDRRSRLRRRRSRRASPPRGIALLDAPVSGGPAKAAAGTMTMMVVRRRRERSAACGRSSTRITGRVFALGPRAGDASTFKIVNNLLAGANLAAGAEALALARGAPASTSQRVLDVVNASSGGSWIFADRVRARARRRPRAARRREDPRQGRRHRRRRSPSGSASTRRSPARRTRRLPTPSPPVYGEDDDAVLDAARRRTPRGARRDR